MALLSRVADRVYWGARQMERAEDTARIMRAFSDVFIDFPMAAGLSWEP
ncbi:MAG: alpha-E domain-containing protein, partial [Ilumatobacteraceae bacterium]